MKRSILGIFLILSMFLTGCTVVEKAADVAESLTPSQATLATLAIKAGTVDLILKDAAKSQETATTIVSIVTEASSYLSGGTVSIVSDLDAKLTERIAKLNLPIEKQAIVDILIAAVKAKIEAQITGDFLNADTIVVIDKVLTIIKTTAESYE